jgi:hypothetical protein
LRRWRSGCRWCILRNLILLIFWCWLWRWCICCCITGTRIKRIKAFVQHSHLRLQRQNALLVGLEQQRAQVGNLWRYCAPSRTLEWWECALRLRCGGGDGGQGGIIELFNMCLERGDLRFQVGNPLTLGGKHQQAQAGHFGVFIGGWEH